MSVINKTYGFLEDLHKHFEDINYSTLVRARIGNIYSDLVKSEEFKELGENTESAEPFLRKLNKTLNDNFSKLNLSDSRKNAKSIIIPIVREYKLSLLE